MTKYTTEEISDLVLQLHEQQMSATDEHVKVQAHLLKIVLPALLPVLQDYRAENLYTSDEEQAARFDGAAQACAKIFAMTSLNLGPGTIPNAQISEALADIMRDAVVREFRSMREIKDESSAKVH